LEKNTKILDVNKLHVSHGAIKAVKDLSLEVYNGEIVTIIGANGAGKTSFLEALIGINTAESGTVLFNGKDITKMSTDKIIASGLCLIPEGRGILSSLKVMENLQLGAYHLPKNDFGRHLKRVFKLFPRLEERIEQTAGTLSGGEQQMLSIARGLMSSPSLIIMDEPSLGLAPVIVDKVFEIIVDLNREGYSILLSEQTDGIKVF